MREKLAAQAHEMWSGWTRYLFSQCLLNDDGSATIPMKSRERWQRQLHTPYADLPDSEKESDRKEADELLKIIGEA